MSATNENMKIGFLGGGKMAEALVKGFISAGLVKPENVVASVTDLKKDKERPIKNYGVTLFEDNKEIVRRSNIVVIAVKPHLVAGVLREVTSLVTKEHLVLSIAAGVTLTDMAELLPAGTRLVRLSVNTPSMVQLGVSIFTAGPHCTSDDCDTVKLLFSNVGFCDQAPEHLLAAASGVSGCGPAFMFMSIEAMSDGGVKMGLPRDLAIKLAAHTMMGAGKMVLETGQHPGQLKDAVTSPGGSTITGVHELEKAGLRAAFINAIETATNKNLVLGQKK